MRAARLSTPQNTRIGTVAGTLADAVLPPLDPDRRLALLGLRIPMELLRDVALVVGFAWFVALCAQIAVHVPWTPVPITGQTFAVLVTGGALGAARGGASLSVYMLMGIIGIPVFAPTLGDTGDWYVHFILSASGSWDGTADLVWNLGSGGYIVGFILSAMLVGWLAERQWDRKPWVHLGMLLGNVTLYVPGLLWLAYWIASRDLLAEDAGLWGQTLDWGLYPFIVGDLMKLLLASLVLPLGWALVNRRKRPTDDSRPADDREG